MHKNDDSSATIVALATAPSSSALAIIRISGSNALKAANTLFYPINNHILKPRLLTLGWIMIDGKKIDQAMAVFMPNPNSYTGDDTVELHLHGSIAIVTSILNNLTKLEYVRAAEPGEFTKRAFLNNKIDLMQAEAVAELIASKNEKSAANASYQLNGNLSKIISECKKVIIGLSAYYIANLDFSEEDIPSLLPKDSRKIVEEVEKKIAYILKNSRYQFVVREGLKVALIGLPNAGKSTLLNSLLGFDRAIVTSTAGTTRDVLSESIRVKGIDCVLTDTAGLRESGDVVERIGIERTKQEILASDHIFMLIEPEQQDKTFEYLKLNNLLELVASNKTTIIFTKEDIKKQIPNDYFKTYRNISITNNTASDQIVLRCLEKIITEYEVDTIQLLTTRQKKLLTKAQKSARDIVELIDSKITDDVILIELQQLIDIFNILSGEHTTEEMITEVFSNFCIGK